MSLDLLYKCSRRHAIARDTELEESFQREFRIHCRIHHV